MSDIRLLHSTGNQKIDQILNICLATSAIIAHKAQYHVKDKHEAVRLYRAEVGDAWSDFIQELYEVGRNQWDQIIPRR